MLLSVLLALATTIRSAADLAAATFGHQAVGTPFEFDATLQSDFIPSSEGTFAVQDASGPMIVRQVFAAWATNQLSAGTLVHLRGTIEYGTRSHVPFANCSDLSVLGPGPAPVIPTITGKDFASGRFDCRVVRIVARVRDAFPDEIDPGYAYLVLDCDGETVYLPKSVKALNSHEPMIGSTIGVGYGVEVSGVCVMENENWRPNAVFPRIKGFTLVVRRPDDIRVVIALRKHLLKI